MMELFDLESITSDRSVNDRFVSVIVDCIGIDDLLTYRIPEEIHIQIGDILSVPLGNRHVGAIALDISDTSTITDTETEIKSINSVVSSGIFPKTYWEMLKRTADYYRTPLMQTIKTALPPKLLDQSHYRIKVKNNLENNLAVPLNQSLPKASQIVWDFLQEHKTNPKGISRRYIQQKVGKYANSGLKELQKLEWIESILELPNRPQPKYEDIVILLKSVDEELTERQAEILTILQHQGGECLKTQLYKLAKTTTLQALVNKGYVAITKQESLRLGGKSHTVNRDRPKALTPDQDVACLLYTSPSPRD